MLDQKVKIAHGFIVLVSQALVTYFCRRSDSGVVIDSCVMATGMCYDDYGFSWLDDVLSSVSRVELRALFVTVLMILCGAMGLDSSLPALPAIMHALHTDKSHMHYSVVLFVLGVGLSILLYGPLSDHVGRRPVAIWGMVIACLASFLSAMVASIDQLLLCRFVQGIGSGVCWGLGRVIVMDVLTGDRFIKIGFYFTAWLSISPMLAPLLGAHMLLWFGWRSIFVLLGMLLFAVIIVLLGLLDETNGYKVQHRFDLRSMMTCYLSLLTDQQFVCVTLLSGVAVSASIVFLALSPYIFQKEFHVSPIHYAWLTASLSVWSILSKWLMSRVMASLSHSTAFLLGAFCIGASGLLLFFLHYLDSGKAYYVLLCMALCICGVIISRTLSVAMALSRFHQRRGAAGALYGSIQMIISSFSGYLASIPRHSGSLVLACAYVVLGILGYGLCRLLRRAQRQSLA